MKPKTKPTEFGEEKAAPFKGDLLGREQEIKALTPMITHPNFATPATMALNAEWGAGKTAFIKMWQAHLNNEASARAFYFNAWETDFAADPFVPFVETITADMSDKREVLMESAKVFSLAIGDVVGRATGAGALVDVATTTAKHFFVPRSELKKFKDALGKFVKSQGGKRVVIFVDELDRCRPDYAVKVLERIKHLFEVPGVVFVLATNREQLRHSVNALYGANLDADEYLRRFIEFDYTIKAPDKGAFISARLKGLEIDKFLHGRTKRNAAFMHDDAHLCNALTLLAKVYKYSLRDAEQLLTRVVLVLWTLKKTATDGFYPILLAFLVIARLKRRDFYCNYILPANDGTDMHEMWENDLKAAGIWGASASGEESAAAAYITAHIVAAKATTNIADISECLDRKAKENKLGDMYWQYPGILAKYIKNWKDGIESEIDLRHLVKKIEMLDQFRFPDDTAEGGGN